MIVIDTTTAAADQVLAAAAAHAGPGVELGTPVLAVGGHIVTDLGPDTTGLITSSPAGATRTVELPTGLLEVTRWRDGLELSRVVG